MNRGVQIVIFLSDEHEGEEHFVSSPQELWNLLYEQGQDYIEAIIWLYEGEKLYRPVIGNKTIQGADRA